MMPSKWKKGVFAISKVRRLVEQEIRDLFSEKGLSPDDVKKKYEKYLSFIV
jgi:hypothetical protein